MTNANLNSPLEVSRSILVARGTPVMLDADLAALYGVSTKALNQAVKRNLSRFPSDFAFRLTMQEARALWKVRASSSTQRHRDPRLTPHVFTEHGATMLAMTLQSPQAIDMSLLVVRAFAALRDAAKTNAVLQEQLTQLEARIGKHDVDIAAIFTALRQLMTPPQRPKRGIGFLAEIK
jgi:hypothetical protein